jgi:hypothetical protein
LDKEKTMGFEKRVLDVVAKVVGEGKASFTSGTLFVECTIPEAVRIETALLAYVDCGIILSRVGDESAYDFV